MDRVCAKCGAPLKKHQKKFCSKSCASKGRVLSEETKRKISESHMGNKNPNYGKKASQETRDKMSKSHEGRTHTEESKRKMSEYAQNRTEEHLRNLSESLSGRTLPDEVKAKISESKTGKCVGENNPFYGCTHSEETKSQIRESFLDTYNNYEYDPEIVRDEYRRIAIEEYGYICSVCRTTDHILQVHHINGDHYDDRLENLVVLCPSCHAKAHNVNGKFSSSVNEDFKQIILESRGE